MDKGYVGKSGKTVVQALQGFQGVPGKEKTLYLQRLDGQGSEDQYGFEENVGVIS